MTKRVKLSAAEVAERVGCKPSTWRGYVARGQRPGPNGYFAPDRPFWYESTITPEALAKFAQRRAIRLTNERVSSPAPRRYPALRSVCMVPDCGCSGYAHV